MATNDFTKGDIKDFLSNLPTDSATLNKSLKQIVNVNQKLSEVALSAAEQSAAVSSNWTRQILDKMDNISKEGNEPADYMRKVSELSSSAFETATNNLTSYAEIARKIQVETLEVLLSAGKVDSQPEETPKKANKTAPSDTTAKVNAQV